VAQQQLSLWGHDEPALDLSFGKVQRRILPRGAWLEYVPGWLSGHATLFETLLHSLAWRSGEEMMYERMVQVPRMFASLADDGPSIPTIEQMRNALSSRYRSEFSRVGLALYRDGRDSVALHGDRVAREMHSALVATVSVGAPRRFLLRPHGGGSSIAYNLGWGDLLVMGGTCQRTWQHGIPKVAHAAPRIAIMFRPDWSLPPQPRTRTTDTTRDPRDPTNLRR
jgi:alkylated DNA repair dioxygenase AlkB